MSCGINFLSLLVIEYLNEHCSEPLIRLFTFIFITCFLVAVAVVHQLVWDLKIHLKGTVALEVLS